MILKYLVFILVLFTACKKEESTNNKFIIYNLSGTTVKILPTKSMMDSLVLIANKFKEFQFPMERGIGTGDNYAFFADGNQVSVVFNSKDTLIHYPDNSVHLGTYYNVDNNRNFYNKLSYQKDIVDDTKYQRTVTLKYIFTQQDYLDAQNK